MASLLLKLQWQVYSPNPNLTLNGRDLERSVRFLLPPPHLPHGLSLKSPDMFLTPSFFILPPLLLTALGHLQSHPTLPITSSILLTAGAPKLKFTAHPHIDLTNPHFTSGAFLSFHSFSFWGGKRNCGCSVLSLNVRWNDVDFDASV